MSDPVSVTTRSGTPFWVRSLLVLSLALNLLILGLVLGAVIGGGPGGDRRADRDPGAVAFVRALEPDERRALLRQMRREGGERLPEARAEMRARRDALLETLRADPFDRAAADALLAAQAEDGARRQTLGRKVLLDHLEGLSAADRRAYADRLERALEDEAVRR